MVLKQLEIQGFKSFPDRTRILIEPGITAVVGPNGSGKSNISDAIRWVLGETSSRQLRGSGKMEDVIFGGTQMRGAMGFASVALTVNNSDRRLDIDADEVVIGRKYYRSGESEYTLNGQAVRLKDIYELLLDTGVGRDGYSIIGQGRIAEIVGAKSAERREIFEEARKSNVILLFDEADSLFSKRTDIKDSHDRNANIEVSFLLQQLEDHDGITILTTNKDQNIDEAFNRRITFKISFSKPYLGVKGTDEYSENYELIKGLWKKFINNGKIPLANDIDYDYLTTHFNVTGSDVRKAVTTAAFLACKEKSDKLYFKHILKALKAGLKKRKDDFGYEYHTFVDEIFK